MKTTLFPQTPVPQTSNQPEQVRMMILEAECLAERDLGQALSAALEAAELANIIKDRLGGTQF